MAEVIQASGENVTSQGPTLLMGDPAETGGGSVSERIYTIGAAGDYTSWGAAMADWEAGLFAGSVATDDIVLQEIDGAAYDEQVTINDPGVAYNSLTLTASPSARHNGTAGSGARFVFTGVDDVQSYTIYAPLATNAYDLTIEWLEIDNSQIDVSHGGHSPLRISCNNASSVVTIRNCIVHCGTKVGYTNFYGIETGVAPCVIANNLVYDMLHTSAGSSPLTAIRTAANSSTPSQIINNTIYNIVNNNGTGVCYGVYVFSNTSLVANNAIAGISGTTSGTIQDLFIFTTPQQYNATSDSSATGTGSVTGIASAVWNDPDNGDFQPATGSSLYEAGTDLGTTYSSEVDITGRDRDAQADTWSIGAWQVAVGEGGATIKYGVDTGVDGYVGQQVGSQVGA